MLVKWNNREKQNRKRLLELLICEPIYRLGPCWNLETSLINSSLSFSLIILLVTVKLINPVLISTLICSLTLVALRTKRHRSTKLARSITSKSAMYEYTFVHDQLQEFDKNREVSHNQIVTTLKKTYKSSKEALLQINYKH